MEKLLLIDGNSIMNRAFYGIMGNKMLTTKDGTYTNAVYGFLAILFKTLEEVNPEYLVVTFDLKAPTHRHKLYDGYKATRKGMPDELREQMPIIKKILRAMNITIIEIEGYEADDIIGTLSCIGENQGKEVVILSGDRDNFQLLTDKVSIRIPRTKMGKTETEIYDRNKIIEEYGLEPKQLIEVKGLQGDSSDNIPGVPGIGEKTAISLIKKYNSIEELYHKLEKGEDDLKGKQKEKISENKELAFLSKTLGTINLEVPVGNINEEITQIKVQKWDEEKVLEIFKELNFKRFIERFSLQSDKSNESTNEEKVYNLVEKDIKEIIKNIKEQKECIFYITTEKENQIVNESKILKEKIKYINIYNKVLNENYSIKIENEKLDEFKEIFEDENIKKISIGFNKIYILLNQVGIHIRGIYFDIEIAAYILNPTDSKFDIETLIEKYLEIDIENQIKSQEVTKEEQKSTQISLFDKMNIDDVNDNEKEDAQKELLKQEKYSLYTTCIEKIKEELFQKLEQTNSLKLFLEIDMPTIEVLSEMQLKGIYVDKKELEEFGIELSSKIKILTKQIHEKANQEFNINSPKQLGEILFDKMKLPVIKKTKSGYSTDNDVLEKLKKEDEIIELILEYRQLMKLNSTYIEGLKQYINKNTNRIHSFFHQTITATGRISSTEPNLQNIPTRFELGKRVRKVFKPEDGYIYLDADYSQIELRVLAHISEDTHMIEAFKNNEDIHKQAASKVFKTPLEEVSKEQRSSAKAVNFGIVYGISDFGLSEQLGISKKMAKQYIDEYLEEYVGIKSFMDNIIEEAKEKGYVETLFNRRRYIPELKSSNYMVRQFGGRIAMNTPIQGTAADIMKIAMIKVYNELNKRKLKSKIVLQVHDEMLLEVFEKEKEEVKEIILKNMQESAKLNIPLIAEISEAKSWYECK